MIARAIGTAAGAVAAAVALQGAWWSVLSVAALGTRAASPRPEGGRRLVAIVPAHNEAEALPACLASLAAARYEPRPEVVVVADNCTDGTAAVARSFGATVLERHNPGSRGKGFALEAAIEMLAARPSPPEALIIIDADSTASANFFAAVDAVLADGAEAVQAFYRASDGPGELLAMRRLAFLLMHRARPLGERRLGVGSMLRGNGMGFRWSTIRDGIGAAGLAEDSAMTLALAERGIAVRYVPEASVTGMMPATYADAAVQDRRWEAGRAALTARAWAVLRDAVRRGRFAIAPVAIEVAAPPLTVIVLLAVGCGVAGAAGLGPAALMLAAPLLVGGSMALGLQAAGAARADAAALRGAPRFVVHKLQVYWNLARAGAPAQWERTARA